MSPEQALGRDLDQRSDIFSHGVVIYEMLTGRLPFEGASATEIVDGIVHKEPAAIARFNYDVPPELERIVRKCMEKDRERRYHSSRELSIDLRNLQRDSDTLAVTNVGALRKTQSTRRGRSRKAIDSLAILPLINAGGDPDTEYLSDGITESIINNLSQLPRLRVMARSTVFRYKGREVDPQRVGQELGVRATLSGRVLQPGNLLIIKAELVDTEDGSHLWGEQYNRKLSDIFVIEDEISREISDKLRLKLHVETARGREKLLEQPRHGHILSRQAENRFADRAQRLRERLLHNVSRRVVAAHQGRYAPAIGGVAAPIELLECFNGRRHPCPSGSLAPAFL
jgi:serine/threonine-protein kinase